MCMFFFSCVYTQNEVGMLDFFVSFKAIISAAYRSLDLMYDQATGRLYIIFLQNYPVLSTFVDDAMVVIGGPPTLK